MNRDEILNLEATRQTDILIAKEVFGWLYYFTEEYKDYKNVYVLRPAGYSVGGVSDTIYKRAHHQVPYYSLDISIAWPIVEKLHIVLRPSVLPGKWVAGRFLRVYVVGGKVECDCEATAETAPLAICRTALLITLEKKG